MTTPIIPSEKWEKEFDRKFMHLGDCGKQKVGSECFCGHTEEKDFIRSLLLSREAAWQKEMLKKIEQVMTDAHPTFMIDKGMISEKVYSRKEEGFKEGFQSCLSQIKSLLK